MRSFGPIWQGRRSVQNILVQPGGTFASPFGHSLKGQLLVIVVEHFKAVIAAVANDRCERPPLERHGKFALWSCALRMRGFRAT
jgi:hypothetical protein